MTTRQTQDPTRVVFFGNEQLSSTHAPSACPSFNYLCESPDYEVVGLVVKANPQKSRKQRTQPILKYAEEHDVTVYNVTNKEELLEATKSIEAEVAILAAFGLILPEPVLSKFRLGVVNIHPSLLPKYRGPTPIETAMINGDEKTGVSIMALGTGMDDGPLYGQLEYILPLNVSKAQLTNQLTDLGAKLLQKLLPEIIEGTLEAQEQVADEASYTKKLSKNDRPLDFNSSAEELERIVRAQLDFPGSTAILDEFSEDVVTVTEASVDYSSKTDLVPGTSLKHAKGIVVYCTKDHLLITRVKPANRNEMAALEWLNGLH